MAYNQCCDHYHKINKLATIEKNTVANCSGVEDSNSDQGVLTISSNGRNRCPFLPGYYPTKTVLSSGDKTFLVIALSYLNRELLLAGPTTLYSTHTNRARPVTNSYLTFHLTFVQIIK